MKKQTVGLLWVLSLLVLTSAVYAESGNTGAACDPKSGQDCTQGRADAKSAVAAEVKAPVPAPAAATEAKPAAPAPASKPATAETAGLAVEEAVLATAIENRAPQGAAETFPATTEKLYCYTKLTGGKPGDSIVHKWSHEGKVVSEITLKVDGSPWRTFSSKTLGENAAGAWQVEIVQNNAVLKTAKFEVTK